MDSVLRNGVFNEMEERLSIRDFSKTPRKYGSTARHVTRNQVLVKHLITSTDTLQGIALKYGVTTEQIRRINKLWATDSLFLREHLLIPVSVDSPFTTSLSTVASYSESFESINNSSPSSVTSPIEDNTSAIDFLAKMDSSIASVKKEIKKSQGASEFASGDDIQIRRKATSRLRNSYPLSSNNTHLISIENQRPSSANDIQASSAVVMTQGKKIKTSLQRLQQEQDEMFQL